MKKNHLFLLAFSLLFFSCDDDGDDMETTKTMFTVTIENVATSYNFLQSGVFNTPDGDDAPGPATPGKSYSFMFNAGNGHKLSFTSMYGQSNDLFVAPMTEGIDLFDENGDPISGDITSMIYLWDAGTEVNEEPGVGENQAPRQSGPNTGADENGMVKLITDVNDGFTYPMVSDLATFMLTHISGSMFKLTITVDAGSPTPLSPGVWVVHTNMNPLFTDNMADAGNGIEAQAEDGDPSGLASYAETMVGLATPLSPGVYIVHSEAKVLFEENMADYGEGLEHIAEDADPTSLSGSIGAKMGVSYSGVFNTPVSESSPGPALPGLMYQFTIEASEGDYLSFATMFGQSNDLFFAPGDMGIALFKNGTAVSGDVSSDIMLWDAGTEMNEFPGAGPNQAPRQSGPNTGTTETMPINVVNDGYTYPMVSDIIKVTITAQ